MFEFACDSCQETAKGATRNEAILSIIHDKNCDDKYGVPIHYTRINKKQQAFFCINCETEHHESCVGFQNGSHCECPKCYLKIPE